MAQLDQDQTSGRLIAVINLLDNKLQRTWETGLVCSNNATVPMAPGNSLNRIIRRHSGHSERAVVLVHLRASPRPVDHWTLHMCQ